MTAHSGAPTANGDPPPEPDPPAPGTAWQRELFEHFIIDWRPASYVWFKNLLCIRSRLDDPCEPRFTFDLKRALGGAFCAPLGCFDAVVEYDTGCASAKAIGQPDEWAVNTSKTIRITSPEPQVNLWIAQLLPIALRAMGDEVREGICCDPLSSRIE